MVHLLSSKAYSNVPKSELLRPGFKIVRYGQWTIYGQLAWSRAGVRIGTFPDTNGTHVDFCTECIQRRTPLFWSLRTLRVISASPTSPTLYPLQCTHSLHIPHTSHHPQSTHSLHTPRSAVYTSAVYELPTCRIAVDASPSLHATHTHSMLQYTRAELGPIECTPTLQRSLHMRQGT